MNLKHILWMLFTFSVVLPAQATEKTRTNQVQFSAEAVREIERDEMQVVLYLQEESQDAHALNQLVVDHMNHALALVKKQPAVEIFSQQRYTQVRYNKEGKQNGWVERVELVLKSKDMAVLSTLVTALNQRFKIAHLSATVSQQRLVQAEQALMAEVLQKFEQKAQHIQSLMKAKGYRLITLNLEPNLLMDSSRHYAVAMKGGDSFYHASSHDDMALETGKTTLKSMVQAKIELIND